MRGKFSPVWSVPHIRYGAVPSYLLVLRTFTFVLSRYLYLTWYLPYLIIFIIRYLRVDLFYSLNLNQSHSFTYPLGNPVSEAFAARSHGKNYSQCSTYFRSRASYGTLGIQPGKR